MEDLVIWPDQRLNRLCKPITVFNPTKLKVVTDRMFLNMRSSQGIGIAAPQVGHELRIVMWDNQKLSEGQPDGVLVNPEITWRSEETEISHEGCLSFPGLTVSVLRHKKIQFRGYDIYGAEKGFDEPFEAEGLAAYVLQHEIDHLDGKNIVDNLSKLKRDILRKKLSKWKDHNEQVRVFRDLLNVQVPEQGSSKPV
jgi:peptide deformylase